MANGTVTVVDPDLGVQIINDTGVETSEVRHALVSQHPEVAALIRWTVTTQGDVGRSRQGGIFQRDRFVTPTRIFDQFNTAQDAVDSDDVVSGVMDSTEALAFGKMSFFNEDPDEEDIWNQISFDIDLDTRIREMWRELFMVSQFYYTCWWGKKDYKVRGKSSTGIKRKKVFGDLTVPLGVSILDPQKVVPVGNLMFNQEQLAYIADRTEVDTLDAAVLNDPQADPVSRQIIVAKYAPPDYERRNLAKLGINAEWLYILNPRNVFRHTLTRPQYQRFASVRMVSIFELLDLKHQLRQMDRAHLLGGSNFIVVIRKGTDKLPAKPSEIQNLQEQVRTIAAAPVLVGDHRLSVEIVTPKQDTTLSQEKYGAIDSRITTRLYQMFLVHGGAGAVRSDDSVKLAKVIARGLESRRNMLKRVLERQIIGPTVDANESMSFYPTIRFHPQRIELDFDMNVANMIVDMRDRGDISRETYLAELDFDQEHEAINRQREAELYDEIFAPTNVPFSTPAGTTGVVDNPRQKGPGQADEPKAPAGTPPHSHAPDGTPVALPPGKAQGATKKAATQGGTASGTTTGHPTPGGNPRTAGRRLGGNKNGGGAPGPAKRDAGGTKT